jgi:hypothetical protein
LNIKGFTDNFVHERSRPIVESQQICWHICWPRRVPTENVPTSEMPLTDTAIRKAKPGANTLKLSDGGGLQCTFIPTARNTGASPIVTTASRRSLPSASIPT